MKKFLSAVFAVMAMGVTYCEGYDRGFHQFKGLFDWNIINFDYQNLFAELDNANNDSTSSSYTSQKFAVKVTLDKSNCSIRPDIDNNCLVCEIKDAIFYQRKQQDGDNEYLLLITTSKQYVRLYFDNPESARAFGSNYYAGKTIVLPCQADAKAIYNFNRYIVRNAERKLAKPAVTRRRVNFGKKAAALAKTALIFTTVLIANRYDEDLAQSIVDRTRDINESCAHDVLGEPTQPGDFISITKEEISPPVYIDIPAVYQNRYAYEIDLAIRFKDCYNWNEIQALNTPSMLYQLDGNEIEKIQFAAKNGSPNAQSRLGECYYDGKGVGQNYEEAVIWYRKAAEQGYAKAQNYLGVCYELGRGVERDYTKAVRWYWKAAQQNLSDAQYNLGICYSQGKGVGKDDIEAISWYRKAAEQGDADAQNKLGECYYDGKGVGQDYNEAAIWYRRAAEQGHAKAQNYLGVCYELGRGVERDYTKAVRWYWKAAQQNLSDAQYNLALCYSQGKGVGKDDSIAVAWLRKAAEQGDADAKKYLEKLGYY